MAPEQAEGQDEGRRPGGRRLRAGGDPLRAADRPPAVPGGDGAGHAPAGQDGRAGAAVAAGAGPAARRRDDRLKCLQKDPAKRYESAAGAGRGPASVPGRRADRGAAGGIWERGWKWARRRPAIAAMGLGLLATSAALLGLGLHSYARIGTARAGPRRALPGRPGPGRGGRRPIAGRCRPIAGRCRPRCGPGGDLPGLAERGPSPPRRPRPGLRNERWAPSPGWRPCRPPAATSPSSGPRPWPAWASSTSMRSGGSWGAPTTPPGSRSAPTAGPWSPATRSRRSTSGTSSPSVIGPACSTRITTRRSPPRGPARRGPGPTSGPMAAWPSGAGAIDSAPSTPRPGPRARAGPPPSDRRNTSWPSATTARATESPSVGRPGGFDLIDVASRAILRSFPVPDSSKLALSPDGLQIAYCDFRAVLLRQTDGDHAPIRLDRHVGVVTGIAFSPDGHTLASTSYDTTTVLWDVAVRRERLTLRGTGDSPTGPPSAPTASPSRPPAKTEPCGSGMSAMADACRSSPARGP